MTTGTPSYFTVNTATTIDQIFNCGNLAGKSSILLLQGLMHISHLSICSLENATVIAMRQQSDQVVWSIINPDGCKRSYLMCIELKVMWISCAKSSSSFLGIPMKTTWRWDFFLYWVEIDSASFSIYPTSIPIYQLTFFSDMPI